MALDADRLGLELAAVVLSPEATPEDKAKVEAIWKAFASAIITEFTTNGVISLTIPDPAEVAMTAAGVTPTDGGATLKSTYLVASAAIPDKGKGTIA